jgi:hydroxyethylthiazole kinase
MPAEGPEIPNPSNPRTDVSPNLADVVEGAATLLGRLRARAPKVHCITNGVAQNFTANVLLAAGGVPSMTLSPEEIAPFVARADALLVNLGTFDRERREATEIAVETAGQNQIPWVLDPVFVDRAPPRAAFARTLVDRAPKVVRLNGGEFATLAGAESTAATLATYAQEHATVVALSGETDLVGDGARLARIANGHPLMAKVTAVGCAGAALVAACLAVEPDPWRAATAGALIIGVAGELAGSRAEGPGSFAASILDALYRLDEPTLLGHARVT